jgi:histidinol dehydrogenase
MVPILTPVEVQRRLGSRAVVAAGALDTVGPIIDDVRKRGDSALIEWATKLDGLGPSPLKVAPEELKGALERADATFLQALQIAAKNIRAFAKFQMPVEKEILLQPGLRLGQIIRPLETIGAYVPGGVYPLPSTLLMTVIPAQVAGVKSIYVANPRPAGETLAAGGMLGVENFIRIGGAQAIAAFAFGTETVPRVDRIVGPGNVYVAAAKKLLAGEVAIDSIAGPSEVVIVADEGDPHWIAADMLAQAEHDADASSILITTSKTLADLVQRSLIDRLDNLSTRAVAEQSLSRNGGIVITTSAVESVDLANELAPEHLCLYDPGLLSQVHTAGSIFLGPYSTESLGDYATGPNHVLPTGGNARSRGGLSVLDYLKVITYQRVDKEALSDLSNAVTTLARAEGLEAHAQAVEARL